MASSGRENQLSRYGAISKILDMPITGKVFLVASNSDTVFSSVLQNFPIDIDGVSRVYSTIQGALDACSDGRGDLVLVLPRSLKAGDTDPGD